MHHDRPYQSLVMIKIGLFMSLIFSGPSFADSLSQVVRRRADSLISVFENHTLEPRYSYIENLHDGRGFTAGRAGFCTATGDLLKVVEHYEKSAPNNSLSKYLDPLRELAHEEDDSVKDLSGFEKAWKSAAS